MERDKQLDSWIGDGARFLYVISRGKYVDDCFVDVLGAPLAEWEAKALANRLNSLTDWLVVSVRWRYAPEALRATALYLVRHHPPVLQE